MTPYVCMDDQLIWDNYRCRIPECGETSKSNPFEPDWLSNAIPASTNIGTGFESCERFPSLGNGTLDSCPANLFNQDQTVGCQGFVYARDESVVYEVSFKALDGSMTTVTNNKYLPDSKNR